MEFAAASSRAGEAATRDAREELGARVLASQAAGLDAVGAVLFTACSRERGIHGRHPDSPRDVRRLSSHGTEAPKGWSLRVLPKRSERLEAVVGEDTVTIEGAGLRYRFGPESRG